MSVVEPLPVSGYGKADWVDYSNYWRESDSEWMQERAVLRYANAADRTAQFPSPKFGQITYNESALGTNLDRPEMYSKQHNKWVALLMLDNITSTRDDSGGVALSHKGAAGKGVQFQPTQTVLDNPILVMGGVLYVDNDSVDIKVGTKTVKLTTDATGLLVDSPLSATALTTGGTLTAVSATLSGSLTVASITLSGTLGGGILNGASGTIGGVGLASNVATASGGFVSQAGYHYGDGGSAFMRYRNPSGGAVGTSYFQTNATDAYVGGNNFIIGASTDTWIQGGKGIKWYDTGGTHRAWISPTIVSGGDPGAGNYPDGTIWIQP